MKSTPTMAALKKTKATVGRKRFMPVEEAPDTVATLIEDAKSTKEKPEEKVERELKKAPKTEEESYTSRLMGAKRRARK